MKDKYIYKLVNVFFDKRGNIVYCFINFKGVNFYSFRE